MKSKATYFELLALLLILIAAADLRFLNIGTLPGWYNDEGTHINLAANLLKGNLEYFGVEGSLLFPSRVPLFVWLLTLMFHFFGEDITTLRILTASIGVINTALIYLVIRKWSRPAALLCALSFAVLPKAVLYARLGFSYNLLALLAILLFWACSLYLDTGQKRYAVAGALVLALSLLSEISAIAYVPVFIIVILWKRWKDLWFALPLAFSPIVLYTIIMLAISPQAYGADLNYALFRVSSIAIPVQFVMILINAGMIHQDLSFLMGALGIFLFPTQGLSKRLILFLFLPLIIFARTNPVGVIGWHYLIPLLPFYAIGFGLAIFLFIKAVLPLNKQMVEQIFTRISGQIPTIRRLAFFKPAGDLIFIVLLVISPIFFLFLLPHTQLVDKTYTTDLGPFLVNADEARAVIHYINENVSPDDLTLASPSIGWAIKGNVTDYHISLAYMGLSTKFFPNDVSHDRFRFDPSYQNAKFIVIDNLWLSWAENSMKDLVTIRQFAEENPIAFQTEHITVYQISGK